MKMRRRRTKLKIIFCMFLVAVIALVLYFQRNVTSLILSVSEASVRASNTIAVNRAVAYTLGGAHSYDDLVEITYDGAGNVTAIVTDSVSVNRIARETAYLSQENLQRLNADGIQIPIGAFTGIESLAGFGQKVNIKIIPIANVNCTFSSEFVQAGVNQTKHSIYLEIVSEISIILPDKTSEIVAATEVLLCENIIVGDIPKAYLQGGLNGGGALLPD